MTDTLSGLTDAGVSIWLNDLSQERLTSRTIMSGVTQDQEIELFNFRSDLFSG